MSSVYKWTKKHILERTSIWLYLWCQAVSRYLIGQRQKDTHFDCLQEHEQSLVFSNSYTLQAASVKSNQTSLFTTANQVTICPSYTFITVFMMLHDGYFILHFILKHDQFEKKVNHRNVPFDSKILLNNLIEFQQICLLTSQPF